MSAAEIPDMISLEVWTGVQWLAVLVDCRPGSSGEILGGRWVDAPSVDVGEVCETINQVVDARFDTKRNKVVIMHQLAVRLKVMEELQPLSHERLTFDPFAATMEAMRRVGVE